MHFLKVKALWPEKKGFHLVRKTIGNEYIFLHLLSPVKIFLNGQWHFAKEGACVLYDRHSYQEFIAQERELLHDYFHLSGDLTETVERLGLSFSTLYYPQNNDKITSIIQQIEQEQLKKNDYYEDFCSLKLTELMIYLARSAKNASLSCNIDSNTYNRFVRLRHDIHTKFDSNLTVEEMAAMVNLSPSRFHSIYKSIFGISPKKDYLNIRIEHAKTILQQRKYSVAQVAMMSGYSNQYHFIRQFKDVVGVTPGKFLKNYSPDEEN